MGCRAAVRGSAPRWPEEADKPALASSRLLSFESFFPYMLPQGINYLRKNLKKWMGRQHRHVAMHLQPASARVVYQSLGVVGIISPWNYPVSLLFMPLATAIAGDGIQMSRQQST
jgi:hypothetical protein